MTIRRLIMILVLALAATTTASFATGRWPWNESNEDVHYHAAFAYFKNGEQMDFSEPKYMLIQPCGDEEHEQTLSSSGHDQERAHLHDGVGDVVHIHRPHVAWGALFENLSDFGFVFTENQVEGYRDGQQVKFLFTEPIRPDDQLLILEGAQDRAEELSRQVPSIQRIRAVEAAGESC